MKTVSLLLVEDDDIDAEALERALVAQRIGNPLHRACDGEEALEMLRGEGDHSPKLAHPVIVLLDLNMPRMNGFEFLKELRNDPKLSHTVVFVLTTSDDQRDRLAAYEAHVSGYIVKNHNAGAGFVEVAKLLESFWRVVEFP